MHVSVLGEIAEMMNRKTKKFAGNSGQSFVDLISFSIILYPVNYYRYMALRPSATDNFYYAISVGKSSWF